MTETSKGEPDESSLRSSHLWPGCFPVLGSVVLTDYAVGLVLLVTLAFIGKEPVPALADLLWGGLAGVAGVLGLLSCYAALARGKMGIAAPISAVLTAALPVLFSAFTPGLPARLQLAGIALAGLAIGLI